MTPGWEEKRKAGKMEGEGSVGEEERAHKPKHEKKSTMKATAQKIERPTKPSERRGIKERAEGAQRRKEEKKKENKQGRKEALERKSAPINQNRRRGRQ